jgi:hypothetical protein
VRSDSPGSNYGSATSVQVDGSPLKHLLLKFNVTGTAGRTVASAKLRLYCLDSSGAGGDFHRVPSPGSWSEGTVTWTTAPAFDSGTVASLGAVSAGTWYEVNVTSLVTGDGVVSLRVTSPNSNGADYSSKEGSASFVPELVITFS